MDISAASLLACGLAYRWTSPGSDSDLSSLSSPETLSPLGYQDSSVSPSSSSDPQQPSLHPDYRPAAATGPGSPGSGSAGRRSLSSSGSAGRRGRVRRGSGRSKQRESASEKEKMRMRDLTKALHYLRSFLPASVAPAGQTLTKIETLRLTIRYISHLSAQLGHGLSAQLGHGLSAQLGHGQDVLMDSSPSETSPSEEASSPDTLGYFQSLYSSAAAQWSDQQTPSPGPGQYQTQLPGQTAAVHPGNCSYGLDLHRYNSGQYGGQCGAAPQGGVFGANMEVGLLSSPATHHSHCQMFGPLLPREYWG